ncbi:outer membrane protein assembly factor BamB family protein [Thermostilla marina]
MERARNRGGMAFLRCPSAVYGAVVAVATAGFAFAENAAVNEIAARSGLVVVIGDDAFDLAAAFSETGARHVCLLVSPDRAAAIRETVFHEGRSGRIWVVENAGPELPFVDRSVDMLVVTERKPLSEEIDRVLVPGGVWWDRTANNPLHRKSWPRAIDGWSHYRHGPDGNPVSSDQLVAPPRFMQWVTGPGYARSHEHIPSVLSVVADGGRIFYIVDEAPAAFVRQAPSWKIVARNAFNGAFLWERSVAEWFPHIVNWGETPRQLQRKIVAVGESVYVAPGLFAALQKLDAATGEHLMTYAGTEGTEEIICDGGLLFLVIREPTPARISQWKHWQTLMARDDSPVFDRDTALPFVQQLKKTEGEAPVRIAAVDAQSGKVLWQRTSDEVGNLRTLTLTASGGRVFYQSGAKVFALDRATGRTLWAVDAPILRQVVGGKVVCAGGQNIRLLDAETGEKLWESESLMTSIKDTFVIDGALWIGGFKPAPGKRSPAWGPYFVTKRDLNTGKVLLHIEPENPGHHHRCYDNVATVNYILGGRRGTEFIDLAEGEVLWNSWVRGVCKYGVMPANGLLYAPPHACACYIATRTIGFNALASRVARKEYAPVPDAARLLRGPAYDPQVDIRTPDLQLSWPTHRHDRKRSGTTSASVGAELRPLWRTQVGDAPTPVTVAHGQVFVASKTQNRLTALDIENGETHWSLLTGTAVDSPPTICGNLAVFGCRDGYVQAVRTTDGAPAWRFLAAPIDRRVLAFEKLESATPVSGAVLDLGGQTAFVCGRNTYLDGGLQLYRLDTATGRLLGRTAICSLDPQTDRQLSQYAPSAMPGEREDLLVADDNFLYLRDTSYTHDGTKTEDDRPHLLTLTGFLDDSWPHRSYWIYGDKISIACGCSGRVKGLIYARIMAIDDTTVYGYGRRDVHWSNQLIDGPYRLFARRKDSLEPQWEKFLPIHVRAMVKAGDLLFVAGPSAKALQTFVASESLDPVLMVISAEDGELKATYPLPAPPVFDGMAAVPGRLLLSLENGEVACFGRK